MKSSIILFIELNRDYISFLSTSNDAIVNSSEPYQDISFPSTSNDMKWSIIQFIKLNRITLAFKNFELYKILNYSIH